ncbi:WcaI family glycosyltransferase [Hymenobacter tibetensis]|uniref:WcaI family glycosyltransferase n=1 Tax=Hymenobacter tibetensis TaxID=497967 RepID=A0ABY4CXW6_9BACT|nr:WcaI family glycosyltransferase [Hymenobacter tibetensis]UOG75100.1 WcaI family glycosyltransferase [Hymenobacter tibetensis]
MKKRILLIGYNFSPEPTGIGKYSGEMMEWLAKNNYACEVITAYPYYPQWKVQGDYYKSRYSFKTEEVTPRAGGRITVHRCPMYVPAVPSGLKRMLLDMSFSITASLKLMQLLVTKKFDVVITVAPSFQFGLLGAACKALSKAKFAYHIQDLQIEAARDLNMIRSKGVIDFLFKIEKFIFNQADYISSISDDMIKKIEAKAQKKVLLFPNWTDNSLFFPIDNKTGLKEEFGFSANDTVVLYSGAIGEKQGLEYILHAAKSFESRPAVKFVICGSGPYKEKLQSMAESLHLKNVVFLPLQPFEKFNKFLNMADIHLVIQKGNAGDLVMPSKLTTILAVGGLAVVTANPGSGLYSLLDKHKMGLLVEAESQQALNEGIRKAIDENSLHLTHNARIYAENYLSIEKVMKGFETAVINP